jgi:hypothetical protein
VSAEKERAAVSLFHGTNFTDLLEVDFAIIDGQPPLRTRSSIGAPKVAAKSPRGVYHNSYKPQRKAKRLEAKKA